MREAGADRADGRDGGAPRRGLACVVLTSALLAGCGTDGPHLPPEMKLIDRAPQVTGPAAPAPTGTAPPAGARASSGDAASTGAAAAPGPTTGSAPAPRAPSAADAPAADPELFPPTPFVPTGSAPTRQDSLRPLAPGRALLEPVMRIADDRIVECSGLAYAGGWWWALNDSGNPPRLYRASAPWFEDAQEFEVPGATNVDWEELAVLGGDLLVCDIGDNGRRRDDLVLYRVRPTAEGVELVATYPVAYPDGRHDAEAVWVWRDRVHIALKDRGEEATWVYRFDALRDARELPAGERNVATRLAALDLPRGEQLTAADVCADGRLALLTYGRLCLYDVEHPAGAPSRTFQLDAQQCEALAWTAAGVVITNEQREVYEIDDPANCTYTWWVPQRTEVDLRAPTSRHEQAARAQSGGLVDAALRNLREGEHVRVGIDGGALVVEARLRVETEIVAAQPGGFGTGVLLGVATAPRAQLGADALQVAVCAQQGGGVAALAFDMRGGRVRPLPAGTECIGSASGDTFVFRLALPVAALFPDGVPDTFLLDVAGNGLRQGDDEPILSGRNAFSLLRPWTWAPVRVR